MIIKQLNFYGILFALLFVLVSCNQQRPPGGERGRARLNPPVIRPLTVEVRVSAGTDDAEERPSGAMYLGSSDLELTKDKDNQTVGIRFNGVDVPANAVITNAYLQFTVDETRNENPTNLQIQGEATDNAATFSSASNNITSRPTTSASVAWSPPNWTTVGEAGAAQQTPDLKTVIQEIVSRPGWSGGNSLALIVSGSGKRVAESYNGESDKAPLLHIEYSTDGTPPPTPDNQAPHRRSGRRQDGHAARLGKHQRHGDRRRVSKPVRAGQCRLE